MAFIPHWHDGLANCEHRTGGRSNGADGELARRWEKSWACE